MTKKQIAIDYLKRTLITTIPIPFMVYGFSIMGLPSNTILMSTFFVSALLLEVQLYHERKRYVR